MEEWLVTGGSSPAKSSLTTSLRKKRRVPAHFCSVAAYKPTFELIPTAGHSPPPFDGPSAPVEFWRGGAAGATPPAIWRWLSALRRLVPTATRRYRLDLLPPRGAELPDFRVLILDSHPAAGVDAEVLAPLHALASRLVLGVLEGPQERAPPGLAVRASRPTWPCWARSPAGDGQGRSRRSTPSAT